MFNKKISIRSIKIIKVEPIKGLTIKAIELESSTEHILSCCNKMYHKFYYQNRITEETYYHKCDASENIIFNKKVTILNDYIVIPELDTILTTVEPMSFSDINDKILESN